MDISVIVPLYNETESLPELAAWIRRVMETNGYSYEILMVDDGSTDGSWDTVLSLAKENPAIHGISFRRNYGKSAALYEGFAAVQGDVVITMGSSTARTTNSRRTFRPSSTTGPPAKSPASSSTT